jgi:hypothetical protein
MGVHRAEVVLLSVGAMVPVRPRGLTGQRVRGPWEGAPIRRTCPAGQALLYTALHAQPALPTLPTLPTLHTLPTLPTLPTLHTLPTLPTLPTLHTLPSLPTLHSLPTQGIHFLHSLHCIHCLHYLHCLHTVVVSISLGWITF